MTSYYQNGAISYNFVF